MTTHAGLLAVSVFVVMVLSGCSDSVTPVSSTLLGETPAEPTEQQTITSHSAASSTTSTDPRASLTQEVLDAWEEFWAVWADVRASEDLDPMLLTSIADTDVISGVVAVLERQHESSGPIESHIATLPSVSVAGTSSASVEDCVLISPSIAESVGLWYQGQFEDDGSGWKLVGLRLKDLAGCVPEAMATGSMAAYEAYYDAEAEFWNPANPAHPRIWEVLADPQREFIMDLLEEHQATGVGFRNEAVHHPEVIEVRSPTELVILDCYQPGGDFGLYDLESGERLPDQPEVRTGQRNLRSAVMVLEGGVWKVSDFQGQVDFECEFAPTDRGLPSV